MVAIAGFLAAEHRCCDERFALTEEAAQADELERCRKAVSYTHLLPAESRLRLRRLCALPAPVRCRRHRLGRGYHRSISARCQPANHHSRRSSAMGVVGARRIRYFLRTGNLADSAFEPEVVRSKLKRHQQPCFSLKLSDRHSRSAKRCRWACFQVAGVLWVIGMLLAYYQMPCIGMDDRRGAKGEKDKRAVVR